MNTAEVDNYPGLPGMNGYELGMKFRSHADALEAKFQIAEVKDIIIEETQKTVRTNEGDFYAKNIIISTRASHRKLGVLGERELAGMGVSYCATCDGAFFKGRTVAVVGGGDVAVGDALFLARGCKKVYLIHRRDELRAAKSLQKKLMALPNVEIIWDTVVNEICGEDQVEALFIENKKTGAKKHLPVDGVFVAVGMKPNTNMVPDEIKKDEAGYIVADENCVTNVTSDYYSRSRWCKCSRVRSARYLMLISGTKRNIRELQKYKIICRASFKVKYGFISVKKYLKNV